uniref:Putative glutathione S-transferase omega class member 2 n=1 Tax=Leptinotarsa decemlineata TaxID=7539 RepID=A0A1P8PEW0_LEPDE|nr:putative glutathione S-transferase omega class member 2 [Leptinotarsa decemlineata]
MTNSWRFPSRIVNFCKKFKKVTKMSSKHLSLGSEDPPRVDGLLRLYAMKFCPFAQRTLLVLKAKEIPHEVVYISLFKKPEWYSKIHPGGEVPALLDGSKVLVQSLDICDYLDEKYLQNPLYPAEPEAKNRDKELIGKIGSVTSVFAKCCFTNEERSASEWLKLLLQPLQEFEDELAKRGTTFFGGERPGMVDYMMWPWAERGECIYLKLGEKLPLEDNHIPLLRKWRKEMMKQPVCQELLITGDRFWKIAQCKLTGAEPAYDEV